MREEELDHRLHLCLKKIVLTFTLPRKQLKGILAGMHEFSRALTHEQMQQGVSCCHLQ